MFTQPRSKTLKVNSMVETGGIGCHRSAIQSVTATFVRLIRRTAQSDEETPPLPGVVDVAPTI
jgi:hypothetical protein